VTEHHRQQVRRSANLDRKVPPNNPEAEMAVLGGILLRNAALDQVRGVLDPEHFYFAANQHVYRAIVTLSDRHEPIDPITLRGELKTTEHLDRIGGPAYINRLLDEVHTTANVEEYARIVRDSALLRNVLNSTHEIQAMIFDRRGEQGEGTDISQILDYFQQEAMTATADNQRTEKTMSLIGDVLQETVDEVDRRMNKGGVMPGLSTGFPDLDEKTVCFEPGELVLLGARPSMGKTALALHICLNVATEMMLKKTGNPVIFFSLEMRNSKLGFRALSSRSMVEMTSLRRGDLTGTRMGKVVQAAAELNDLPLFIDDDYNATVPSIVAKCRQLKMQHGGLALVCIDYLQLMQSTLPARMSKNDHIARISRDLKLAAKHLDVPILVLSQLSRAVESRDDKRPRPSDLRDSGSLEQDADMILFVYREVVNNPDTENPNEMKVIIGKNRQGELGTVRLAFLPWYTKVTSLEKDHEPKEDWIK